MCVCAAVKTLCLLDRLETINTPSVCVCVSVFNTRTKSRTLTHTRRLLRLLLYYIYKRATLLLALRFCATMSQSRTSAPPRTGGIPLHLCVERACGFFVVFLVARTSDSSRNRGEALTFTHARGGIASTRVWWSGVYCVEKYI